jgi:multicomponent Na+:H+ antiporter subunit B
VTPRFRRYFFLVSVVAFFALFVWGLRDLPPFGHYRGPYGDILNRVAVYERHVTDVVTAVNFDYRGFDTLGEESILFMSVIGTALLLRPQKKETEAPDEGEQQLRQHIDESERRRAPAASDAVRVLTLALTGPLVVYGWYLITHGQLTPGGGFQGGVILATPPLLVYIAGDLDTFKRITRQEFVEAVEAAGIFCFVVIGFLGLFTRGAFMQNVLPLGETGSILSGGTIPLLNIATGLAVSGGFVQLIYVFLEQTLEVKLRVRGAQ